MLENQSEIGVLISTGLARPPIRKIKLLILPRKGHPFMSRAYQPHHKPEKLFAKLKNRKRIATSYNHSAESFSRPDQPPL